jgi:aminopeptidase N
VAEIPANILQDRGERPEAYPGNTMARPLLLLTAAFLAICALDSFGDEAVPRGQLPDDVRPERYRLQFDVDPRQEQFSGVAEIDVTVARPVRIIWLHGHGLDVHRVTVETRHTRLTAKYEEVEPVHGVARLALSGELPAGHATLRIDYTGGFRAGAEGLFREQVGGDWYVFSQMEPIDARRVFPGFDEPRFKTPFEITVVARVTDKVVSNAPPQEPTRTPDGRLRHTFQPTLPLPTYLLALAVGPLDIVNATVPANAVRHTPLPMRGVATKGKGTQLAYALKHAPAIIEQLETYFGIPYPYPKLDLIASAQMTGAMENAGAILFNETLLLLDEAARPTQLRSFYETMAHELAHHWFGNLVTPAWWDDIWLNESFAEWMGVKIAAGLRPDLGSRAGLVDSATHAMDVDSKRSGRPIHQPVSDNAQIASTFDSITYVKGGAVLAMMESYLGEQTFRQGVQLHLRRHGNGVATSAEFFNALSDAAQQPPVIAAFRSFVDQPGVPLVSIESTGDRPGELSVTQDRYRPFGTALAGGQLWQLPLCVHAYAGNGAPAKVCSLLAQRSDTLVIPVGTTAVMPNAAGAGYYRFALGSPDLDRTVTVAARLPETEAIVLADSVNAAFRAGRLPFVQFLEAARQLSTHPSRLASIALGSQLVDIKDHWADAATRSALSARIRDLYAPRLAGMGVDVRRGAYLAESAERRQLRRSLASLVVVDGRDPVLRGKVTEAARASLTDPAALDPEFRSMAWLVAVQESGDRFASLLESTLLASDDSLLRRDAAWALGMAEDPRSSARALSLSLHPGIRTTELYGLLGGQFMSPVTRAAAWAWLRENLDNVMNKLPGFEKGRMFGVAESFCDASLRPELDRTLTAKAKEVGSGELEVQRALEELDLCVAQRAALGPSVVAIMGMH